MATEDVRNNTCRIPASVGVFHQALREIESLPQKSSPTCFRIQKRPLIAEGVVVHMTNPGPSNSTTRSTIRWGRLSEAGGVIEVGFITPHPNGIHGEPEITTFPISDREITLVLFI
jgi:hypothetical protein